jgi:enamine deaminase RidA (YjgF/YER057c/UK114 family)
LDAEGTTVAPGDHAGQARQVMANLEGALAAAGAGLADVVKTTVYVASPRRADLVTVWGGGRDAFGDHDPPSTLLGVAHARLSRPARRSRGGRRRPGA